jgi:hypothetical protein
MAAAIDYAQAEDIRAAFARQGVAATGFGLRIPDAEEPLVALKASPLCVSSSAAGAAEEDQVR